MRSLLCLSSLLLALSTRAAISAVTPAEAASLVAAGKAVLVDVREADEWRQTGVAAPALLLAKSDFDGAQKEWKPFLSRHRGQQIILYCRSGRRSGLVAEALAKQGLNVANAGGLKDWQAAGLPLRQPEAPAPTP